MSCGKIDLGVIYSFFFFLLRMPLKHGEFILYSLAFILVMALLWIKSYKLTDDTDLKTDMTVGRNVRNV